MGFHYGGTAIWGSGVLAIALLLLVSHHGDLRRRRLIERVVGAPLSHPLTPSVDSKARMRKRLCLLLALLLAIVSAWRPWWGMEVVAGPRRSRDVLVLLDCSRSMLARDCPTGTRFSCAKAWVRGLADRLPGDRFGLIPFAGTAFLECSLTRDRGALFQYLDSLEIRDVPVQGTNLAAAFREASETFARGDAFRHCAVVLVSDGEERQGDAVSGLAGLLERGVSVSAVGIGETGDGVLVQLPDGSFLRDRSDELVKTRLEEGAMRAVCSRTGGVYVRGAAANCRSLELEEHLRSIVPGGGQAGTTLRPVERYQAPLSIAVACLLIFLFIGERRGRDATKAVATVIACVVSTWGAAAETDPPLESGVSRMGAWRAYGESGRCFPVEDAAELKKQLTDLESEIADGAEGGEGLRLRYSRARVLQRLDEADRASREYRSLIESPAASPGLRTACYHNLAVIRHSNARRHLLTDAALTDSELDAAEDLYREALRLSEDNTGARGLSVLARDRRLLVEVTQLKTDLYGPLVKARRETAAALAMLHSARRRSDRSPGVSLKACMEQTDRALAAVQGLGESIKALKWQELPDLIAACEAHLLQTCCIVTAPTSLDNADTRLTRALDLLGGREPPGSGDGLPTPTASATPNGQHTTQPQVGGNAAAGQVTGDPLPTTREAPQGGVLTAAEASRVLDAMCRDEAAFRKNITSDRTGPRTARPVAEPW